MVFSVLSEVDMVVLVFDVLLVNLVISVLFFFIDFFNCFSVCLVFSIEVGFFRFVFFNVLI